MCIGTLKDKGPFQFLIRWFDCVNNREISLKYD